MRLLYKENLYSGVLRRLFSGLLCLGLLSNIGCAGRAITYSIEEPELKKSSAPIPLRVMVAKFRDSRPEEEKSGGGKGKGWLATADRGFQDIPEGITKAVIEHIRQSRIFLETHPSPFSSAEITSERVESLREKADAILVGSVEHFYGIVYRSQAAMGAMAGAAGAVGGLIGGLIMAGVESGISKEVEGHTALTDLELISTKAGTSLWKGKAESHFKREERGLPDQYDLTLEALKAAVTKLADQLHDFAGASKKVN